MLYANLNYLKFFNSFYKKNEQKLMLLISQHLSAIDFCDKLPTNERSTMQVSYIPAYKISSDTEQAFWEKCDAKWIAIGKLHENVNPRVKMLFHHINLQIYFWISR